MKLKLFSSIAALGLLTLSGVAGASWPDPAPVTVWNESGFPIEQVYISATRHDTWEADLLGPDVLASGYHTTFFKHPGTYDVKLVDAPGDICIVNEVRIGRDRGLVVTPDMLQCEVY